ncbi:hypothetical protein [Streptomyces specialis]|uniref:hypothetical protein n=1 Tax=Streptomyces specialis TaxID=498367 RepID=UPI00073F6098|nr:hypothetical protein [Streptomyces specialis]
MLSHYGPLPHHPYLDGSDTFETTGDSRGFHHLLEAAHWIGEDDDYCGPDGWQRFDRERAPSFAGSVVADLLIYVHDAAGPLGLARCLIDALEHIAAELASNDPEPGGGPRHNPVVSLAISEALTAALADVLACTRVRATDADGSVVEGVIIGWRPALSLRLDDGELVTDVPPERVQSIEVMTS